MVNIEFFNTQFKSTNSNSL